MSGVEIGSGISIGSGITIGDVVIYDTEFITEDGVYYFITEDGLTLIEEK
jgi:hypothetical protein